MKYLNSPVSCLYPTLSDRKMLYHCFHFNSFLASSDFCRLLITFANSLDPDQDQQNVGLDLDPNCLTLADRVPERLFRKS